MKRHDLFDVAAARALAEGLPFAGALTPREAHQLASEGAARIVDIRCQEAEDLFLTVRELSRTDMFRGCYLILEGREGDPFYAWPEFCRTYEPEVGKYFLLGCDGSPCVASAEVFNAKCE